MGSVLFYKNIQCLRALSAFIVVLFHGGGLIKSVTPDFPVLHDIIHQGYLGVDIFFVISGFVAATSVMRSKIADTSRLQYLWLRLSRIYVGYWPFYGLSLLVAWYFSPALLNQWALLKSFFLVFFVNYDNGQELVLYVAWSLTYEVIFYLLASCFIAARRTVQLWVGGFLTFLALIVTAWLSPANSGHPFIVFLSFLDEFLFGVVIYHLWTQTKLNRLHLLVCSTILIALGLSLGVSLHATIGPIRTFTLGAFSAGLVLFALVLEERFEVIAPQPLVTLGDASYSLYLCHSIAFSVLAYLGFDSYILTLDPNAQWALVCLLFAALLGFSVVYFHGVEKPVYRGLLAWVEQSKPVPSLPLWGGKR